MLTATVLGFLDPLSPILLKDSFCVILPAQYLINRFFPTV